MNNQPERPERVEPLYCPTCEGDRPNVRRWEKDLVCGDCYRRYIDEASVALAREGKKISLFEWVKTKAPDLLEILEKKHEAAKAAVGDLNEKISREAAEGLRAATGNGSIPDKVWRNAFREKKQDLWRAKGGNRLFAQMKGLEARIQHLKAVLAEPKKSGESKESASAPNPVIKTEATTVRREKQEKKERESPRGRRPVLKIRGNRSAATRKAVKESLESLE